METIGVSKMIKHKKLSPCPVMELLQLIGNKWKILIIRDLLTGTKRFGELKKSVGCSAKVLTANLKDMEGDELLKRKVFAQVPPRVEYSLSDLGFSLQVLLDDMAEWGTDYQKYCSLKKGSSKAKNL